MTTWNDENVREIVWDKGMPQESKELVRPGDPNYHEGTPVKKVPCGNCGKCKCPK